MQAPQRPAFRGTAQAAPEAEIVTVTESAPPEASSGPRTHVIGLGDTLGKIAKRYYGSADRWPEIYEANRDVLRDPNRLPVTVTIRIP
jgi:nucleoid-associated protein YgaU